MIQMITQTIHLSKKFLFVFSLMLFFGSSFASQLLIPMDEEGQTDHLKAYGIAYFALENEIEVHWLLNYRGGSFLIPHYKEIENECIRFDINSPGKNCKGNSNKFIIFKNLSSPYISLKFCVQYSGGWGWDELTFTFEGTKPL